MLIINRNIYLFKLTLGSSKRTESLPSLFIFINYRSLQMYLFNQVHVKLTKFEFLFLLLFLWLLFLGFISLYRFLLNVNIITLYFKNYIKFTFQTFTKCVFKFFKKISLKFIFTFTQLLISTYYCIFLVFLENFHKIFGYSTLFLIFSLFGF